MSIEAIVNEYEANHNVPDDILKSNPSRSSEHKTTRFIGGAAYDKIMIKYLYRMGYSTESDEKKSESDPIPEE
jgi:hypothetical protein